MDSKLRSARRTNQIGAELVTGLRRIAMVAFKRKFNTQYKKYTKPTDRYSVGCLVARWTISEFGSSGRMVSDPTGDTN